MSVCPKKSGTVAFSFRMRPITVLPPRGAFGAQLRAFPSVESVVF